jgi:hypothetical protein
MSYIYTQINESAFHDAFRNYGRQEQFCYEGRKALFEYLESLAEGCAEPIELDVIALCCDYSEYADIAEYNEAYGTDHTSWEPVSEEATVIEHSNGAAIVSAH